MQPRPIADIASSLGLDHDAWQPYGRYMAKLEPELAEAKAGTGRLVGVTAISPTPLGEGKTVVTIGLAMALARSGQRAVCTLREPSLAPVFGIKGGGAGGGRCRLAPAERINLHFTGDLHAVAAANNLLAAMLDNHVARRLAPSLDPATIAWRRCVDMNDKGLAHVVTGLGDVPQAPLRETGFDLTAASEVMAVLALAGDRADLRRRLGRIVVGADPQGAPVTAEAIGAAGAMAALLTDAVAPNLVQTLEHTPALVHAGPFANIAHGNSSILADRIALGLADYVITESGFGSDCGAEKFFHLKCRIGSLRPCAEVLVATVRSLKFQGGGHAVRPGHPLPAALASEDLDALRAGMVNLDAHLDILRRFDVPVIVAINQFPTDSRAEIEAVAERALRRGAADVAVTSAFERGGEGASDLAAAVRRHCDPRRELRMLYDVSDPFETKLEKLATQVYGADGIELTAIARRKLRSFEEQGFGDLPVCVAKTQYSLSHDPTRLGRPRDYRFPISDVRLSAGAGFVVAMAGDISTLPGLPREPAARRIDVDDSGAIVGMG